MHTSGLKIKILIAPVNWSLWRRSGQSRYLLYRSQDYQCNMAHWLYQRSIFNRRLKLHMTIKHVHKSLASINNNNKKIPFSMSTLSLYLVWLTLACVLTMVLTLSFFILAHNMMMNWWNETLGRRLDKQQNLRLELCAEV